MQAWIAFYTALAGASATLLGLLFVSVSVNAQTILGPGHAHLRWLAEQAFQNYLLVLLISLLVFVPGFDSFNFAVVALSFSLFRGALIVPRIYKALSATTGEERLKSFRRYVATIIGFGMVLYACIGILMGRSGLTLAASGMVTLLLAATVSAWELLIRIAAPNRTDD
jgi:hypothetical protein